MAKERRAVKEALLEYLVCPRSGTSLRLEAVRREGDEVLEGSLISGDGDRYPIRGGIPNLVVGVDEKVERTGDQFAFEFLEVAEPEDSESKRFKDLTLFAAKTGIDPGVYAAPGFDWRLDQDARHLEWDPDLSSLTGKVVMDAGCGEGRFARLVAPHAEEMILLDLGRQIEKARETTVGLGTVHCVRCNLLHVPLREEVVDFAYSIGVIHHTPDPPRALSEIARCVKKGGELAAWVYSPAYWGNPVKGAIARALRRRLLKKPLAEQVAFIQRWLMPLGRAQLRIARGPVLKYLLAPLFLVNVPRHEDRNEMLATVIDYYLPEYIFTYEDDELERIFKEAGMDYRRLPFPTAGRGRRQAGLGLEHGP